MHPTTSLQQMQQSRYPSTSRALAPVVPLRPGQDVGPYGAAVEGEVVEYTETRRPGDELVIAARAAGVVSRWSWRNRFQLSPAAAGVMTMGAASAGNAASATAWWAVITAGVAWWAAKGPEQVAGRTWLSRRERRIGAAFGAGAAAWSGLAALGAMAPTSGVGWATLAAATGVQGVMWATSRGLRVRDAQAHDEQVGEDIDPETLRQLQILCEAWPLLAAAGPAELHDSELDDMHSPRRGVMTGYILLSPNTHAGRASRNSKGIVEYLERALELGIDTIRLRTDRDQANRIEITISPERALEERSVLWTGPQVTPEGRLTIGCTDSGTPVEVALWGKDGARHMVIVGASSSGKSSVARLIMSSGVIVGREVLWHADGKRGNSIPAVARAMSWVTREPTGWRAMITAAHAVMVARENRYGDLALDEFPWQIGDPLLVLFIDEATTVGRNITQAEINMLDEIAMRGRSTGVCLRMGVQRASADCLPGGVPVRENIGGPAGNVVGLRAGGNIGSLLATSVVGADVSLTTFPPGPGWCAIIRESTVVAEQARTYNCPEDALDPFLEHIDLVQLAQDDLAAAQAAVTKMRNGGTVELWTNRVTGAQWHAQTVAKRAAAGLEDSDTGREVITDASGRWLHPVASDPTIATAQPRSTRPAPQSPPTEDSDTAPVPAPSRVMTLVPDVDDDADDDEDDELQEEAPAPFTEAGAVHRGVVQLRIEMAEVKRADVLSRLQTRRLTRTQLAEATGIPAATLRTILRKLKAEGLARHDRQNRWYAVHPAEASA